MATDYSRQMVRALEQDRRPAGRLTNEQMAEILKGAAVGLPAGMADLAGMLVTGASKIPSISQGGRVPQISGDPIREMVGLDPNSKLGMAGEFLDPSGGLAKVLKYAGKLAPHAPDAMGLAMTLFHGTPHKFNKFDLSKIGTGEGAQAFGHGLYFAENPDVAGSYARSVTAKGNTFGDPNMARRVLDENDGDKKAAVAQLNRMAQEVEGPHRQMFYDTANNFDELLTTKGHLYEVDIPDEVVDQMLDWDAPLSEQPESVQKALSRFDGKEQGSYLAKWVDDQGGGYASFLNDKRLDDAVFSDPGRAVRNAKMHAGMQVPQTGNEIYRALQREFGSQSAASEYLQSIGIPGIRFYDGGSRANGEGTRNIVVFDPDTAIKTVKRDGETVYQAEELAKALREGK